MKATTTAVVLALAALASLGCSPPPEGDAGPDDAGPGEDAGTPDAGPYPPRWLSALDDESDLALLADDDLALKYLVPVAAAEPRAPLGERCAFQNMDLYPFHLPFLNALPGGEDITFDDYVALVLARATRAWWGGEVIWREAEPHPITGANGVLRFTLYTQDNLADRLRLDDVREVHAALVACAPHYADALAFWPSSNEQRQTTIAGAAELEGDGIAVILTP